MKLPRWTAAFIIALIGMIASAGITRADATPKVNDAAGFFKPDTLEKIDAELKQLKADTHVEIVVETFEGIPESARAKWEAAKDDPQKKAEFFEKWIDARGHDLKLFGVYVLIVKDPPHLAVRAGSKTHAKALPKAEQDKMSSILLDDFKAKNYDEGLQKAIDYARDTIKQNLNGQKLQTSAGGGHDPFAGSTASSMPPSSSVPPVSGGGMSTNTPAQQASTSIFHGSCMWIVIAMVGVFIVLSLLRRGSSSNNYGGGYNQGPGYGPPGSPGYGGGYGPGPARSGGGFMSGLFGGLLGGAAGSYVENRMENHHQGGGNFPTQSGAGPADDNPASQGDFGSSAGGGDFSGGSGQGDFGSSSSDSGSSGGDFGGGGGGSDFGGGGGGDSGGGSSGGDF